MEWLDPVELPETRVELIEHMLRDAIISGKFNSGEKINEAKIAKQIGVSRSPVREAFRKLEREGFFTIIPQKGIFVASISKQDAREIYTLRNLLETFAVCTAIENDAFTDEDLQEIEEILHQIKSNEKQKKFVQAVKKDWEFHLAICKPSKHAIILEILTMLQGRIWVCMFKPTLFYSKPGEQSIIHQQIFDAIITLDLNLAKNMLNKHHEDSLDALLSKMDDTEENG